MNKPKRKSSSAAGAPTTKFTDENVEFILNKISRYVPYEIACKAAGVGVSTFKKWRAYGEKDLEEGKVTDHSKLVTAIANLQCNHIEVNTGNIVESPTGHGGSQWILSRSYWKYFSDKSETLDLEERLQNLEKKKLEE